MRVIKTDGRYKLHGSGFHYIAQFKWHNTNEQELFRKLITELTDMYGPQKESVPSGVFRSYKLNENWRSEQTKSQRRRRIYLKDEASLSMALLRIGA